MSPKVEAGSRERRAVLDAVLNSAEFQRAPALARLLRYLCEKSLEGKDHEIKEFSIATEVYGKDQNFGDKRDSLVRVEVSRLRKRLRTFYEGEGAGHSLRIVIPAGTYRPDFEPRDEQPEAPVRTEFEVAPVEVDPAPVAVATPERRPATTPRWYAYIGFVIVVLAGVWLFENRPTASRPAVPPPPVPAGPLRQPVRILAGSTIERTVDRFGAEWLGDRYFTGGQQNNWQVGGKEMAVPHRPVQRAPDQSQFHSFRFGNFSYRIPLAPGKYEMRLYFSEVILRPTEFGDGVENRRIFDVLMNGLPLLSSFDIAADAGGADTADIRAFRDVSPVNGYLTLDFRTILVGAWLNAIELIPNDTGRALPIRVVAMNANYTDRDGNLWGIDRYYDGGRQNSDGETVTGTSDPELYRWQRYGNFTYRFPVPAGRYKVRLLLAETFFGPHNRGKGGPGSRIFNVYCDGLTLLKNFDVFKAGGEDHAVEKVFHDVIPNAQGRIDIHFEPVAQYATVQAIEVTEEK
ncbi:MAG: malectin domain-containing carbohydrate-binding protein [Acidobacteriota bacterium]